MRKNKNVSRSACGDDLERAVAVQVAHGRRGLKRMSECDGEARDWCRVIMQRDDLSACRSFHHFQVADAVQVYNGGRGKKAFPGRACRCRAVCKIEDVVIAPSI